MISTDDCMLYAKPLHDKGYAYTNVLIDGRWGRRALHREMYIAFRGEIPEGMVIDHLCRNRPCINPDHLEVVTNEENIRRGTSASYYTDTCNNGHVLAEVGYTIDKKGSKRCKMCQRIYDQTRRPRKVVPLP